MEYLQYLLYIETIAGNVPSDPTRPAWLAEADPPNAEHAATRRLASLNRDARFLSTHAGYVESWHDNPIDGVAPPDFEADLLQASGSELTDRPGAPAKFRAAFSSSAIAEKSWSAVFRTLRDDPGIYTHLERLRARCGFSI